jgi:hypothetical protein
MPEGCIQYARIQDIVQSLTAGITPYTPVHDYLQTLQTAIMGLIRVTWDAIPCRRVCLDVCETDYMAIVRIEGVRAKFDDTSDDSDG